VTGLEQLLATIAAAGGAVGAVWAAVQIGQRINRAMRRQDKIDQMLTRELNGHDGSMKSQVNRVVEQVDTVHSKLDMAKRELSFLQHTVDQHIADAVAHAYDPHAHKVDHGERDDGPAGPRE